MLLDETPIFSLWSILVTCVFLNIKKFLEIVSLMFSNIVNILMITYFKIKNLYRYISVLHLYIVWAIMLLLFNFVRHILGSTSKYRELLLSTISVVFSFAGSSSFNSLFPQLFLLLTFLVFFLFLAYSIECSDYLFSVFYVFYKMSFWLNLFLGLLY